MAITLATSTMVTLAGCNGSSNNGGVVVVPGGTVSTLAGAAASGTANGNGAVARFNNPVNVAADTVGNIYVSDFDNDRIRRITPTGDVTTLTNQTNFQRPFGLVLTPDNRLFAQTDTNDTGARDSTTGTIWGINLSSGAATVVARNLGRPRGLAAVSNTQLVLVDPAQHDVRLLNISNGAVTPLAGRRGTLGFVEGTGNAARFNQPYSATVLPNGNIIVADQNNHRLRQITASGVVTTFAGDGTAGLREGARLQARFNRPQALTNDAASNIYVSDHDNHRIRRITPDGTVSTIAGDGIAGFRDGAGAQAQFFGQEGLNVLSSGATLYIADGNNGDGSNFNRVRRISLR